MRSRWLGLAVVLLAAGFALAVYPRLPAEIPSHWNVRGEVDGRSDRLWGALIPPLVAAGIWGLGWVLPRIDPHRERDPRFEGSYWAVVNLTLLFLALLQVLVLGAALGWPLDVGRLVHAGAGVFFVALGNVLPRMQPNWWMGVRTPWTLSSERVWRSTHRLAGRTAVAGGLLILATTPLPAGARGWAFPAGIALAALVPIVHSYLAWRRESRDGIPDPGRPA